MGRFETIGLILTRSQEMSASGCERYAKNGYVKAILNGDNRSKAVIRLGGKTVGLHVYEDTDLS